MAVGGEVRDPRGFATWIVDGAERGEGTRVPWRVPIPSVNDGDRSRGERRLAVGRKSGVSRRGEVKGQLISRDGRMEVKVATAGIGGPFDDLLRFRPRAEVSEPVFSQAVVSFIVGQEDTRVQKGA